MNEEFVLTKYDVGIIGLWSGCNYGSIATYFALNQVISSMGKSILMIDKPILMEDDVELKQTHSRIFANKHYHISKQYHLNELHELNEICNTFVVGSDQVWNYGISKNFGNYFYLDFAEDNKKKIAYAVSFGHGIDFATSEKREEISGFMRRFDGISTREADGVRLCRDSYGVLAQQVIDPVFLADVDIYSPLINESKFNDKEPYLLTYILDPTPEKRDAILYLQKQLGNIKVINILDGLPWTFERNKKLMNLPNCISDVTVEDWLSYIYHSDFVVTDSCHGASFSLIFKKNFIAMTNKHRGVSRFKSLSELFHIEKRIVSDPRDVFSIPDIFEPIDFGSIDLIMQSERSRCKEWLAEKLNKTKKYNSVQSVANNHRCSGCGACAALCPQNAITLKNNDEGFLNPIVDNEKCVDCGLCLKKCIIENPEYKNMPLPKCYAMEADDETRKVSSSGGMFSVASKYILENGGYVCGAAYKEDFTVEHIIINDFNDLYKLRGSKYIQSNCCNVFGEIKKLLSMNKLVLFTGTPCQVAGLYSFLGNEYETLYTIDLLCHGITSSKVFEKYHHDVLANKDLERLEFKEKEPWGWHAGINAYFTDGTKYSEPLETDPFFIAYLKSISKNSSCELCTGNRLPRQGDLTMGDFWGIAKQDEEMYDGLGTSVVLLNNEKGERLFQLLKQRMKMYKEEPLDAAIRGNKIIQSPYRLNKNRNVFFEKLNDVDFSLLTTGCYKNRLYNSEKQQLLSSVSVQDHELYYLAKLAVEKSNGRQIVTWINSPQFEKILKKYFDKTVAFSVVKDIKKADGKRLHSIELIKGKSSQYYVVSIEPAYSENLYNILYDYGYSEIEDFVFRNHKPIVLKKVDLSHGRYEDLYGNTIEGFDGILSKVIFHGGNNHIVLGNKIHHVENLSFDLSVNSYIEIGDECSFNSACKFDVFGFNGNSSITIKDRCRLTDALIRIYNHPRTSSIQIEDSCTFESNLELHANSGKKIEIGRDCMFSHDIDLWAGDGHSVFDVNTGKNINSDYENLPDWKNKLVIGEHVWISKGAFIMHGTCIGNGSIVGAMSLVKGIFPNNCSIVGNPAKIIKKDIAWSRNMLATDMYTQCGRNEYVRLTENQDKNKRKILILGGTGRMSKILTSLCVNNNDDVTIAVRGKHSLDNIDSNVKVLIFDRLDEGATKNSLSGEYFDVIFDCSGILPQSVDWVLSTVRTERYIYISSFGTYAHYHSGKNLKEDQLPIENAGNIDMGITLSEKDWYSRAKYNSELLIANKYGYINYAIVRIPFVMSMEDDYDDESASRVYKYVEAVVENKNIYDRNLDYEYSFVDNKDEAGFLLYLSNNSFRGVINFASKGSISMRQIIDYVAEKTGMRPLLDPDAVKYPFSMHPEVTLNLEKCSQIGYPPGNLSDWIYNKIDRYIEHAKINKS